MYQLTYSSKQWKQISIVISVSVAETLCAAKANGKAREENSLPGGISDNSSEWETVKEKGEGEARKERTIKRRGERGEWERMKGRHKERNNSSFDIQFVSPKKDPPQPSKSYTNTFALCVYLWPAPKLFRINEHICKTHIPFAAAAERNAGRICYFTIGNENI